MDFITKNDAKNKKNEGKKKLISPLQAKKMAQEKKTGKAETINLLGNNEEDQGVKEEIVKKQVVRKGGVKESVNLLDGGEEQEKSKEIKFQDLIGKEKKKEKEDLYDIIL